MQDKFNDAKKEVRSVLITYQNGVPFDEFLRTYRSLVGQRLPSRALGFSSDIEFLRSIPDVVHLSTNDVGKIILTGIADETSQHIQKLVSKQRKDQKSRSNNKSNRPLSRNRPYGGFNDKELTPFVPAAIRAEITQLAAMYPDGLSFSSFVLAYREKFKKCLPLHRGLVTLENMVKAIPDLEIRTVRDEKKIYPKSAQNSNLFEEPSKMQKNRESTMHGKGHKHQLVEQSTNYVTVNKSGVSDAVQKNFQLVLDKCPEGILALHFPPLYENVTHQTFDLFELGYNSLLDLVDALPWIFQRVLDPSDNKNWIILSANASTKHIRERRKKSEVTNSSSSSQKEPLPVKVCEGLPPGAASPFIPYVQPEMPENINMDEYLPVFVSAIVNPGLFWFQLQTDEEIKMFERLEKDLGFFYDRQYHNFKMKDAHIVPGASCVFRCPDDKQWYRAVIKSIPTADLVNVLYLDYGSRENVSRSELRYARSKYMEYPAHAFKASLAGLKPPNNASSWNTRSQQRFTELCESASLMAYLKPMDNDTYSTYLCDTGGEDDIHINQTLIIEGYAESSFESQFSRNGFINELSDTIVSNGIHNDVELHSASKSSLQLPLSDKTNSDFAMTEEYSPVRSAQGNAEPDLRNLSDNREPSYSVDKHNGVEHRAVSLLREHPKRYIKLSQICDNFKIYIINLKNKLYAPALEITKLLWNDKDSTFLAERLKYKEVDVPTVKISKEDYPELFKQCEWFKLPDLELNSDLLILYPLTWAFNIFNIFGHPSASLQMLIKFEIDHFDPFDPVWKEFCFENSDIDKETENLSKLCLYDLKAKYEALKIKRLKLDKMNNVNAFDEILKTQQLQSIIEKRIKFIEVKHSLYPNYC